MEARPQRVLNYKTYNSIGHLSLSRLGDGDHHQDSLVIIWNYKYEVEYKLGEII